MLFSRKEIFQNIYHVNSWGGKSRSGPGSDPQNIHSYIRFINHWLKGHPDCQSIVELGCGDWATTRHINLLPSHSYTGMDIVPGIVSANNQSFQSQTIRFECADFLSQPPPCADLLLIKDVLQHLSNHAVQSFQQKVLPRYRHAIITNDAAKYEERRRFGIFTARREIQKSNIDIRDGSSRPLKLADPPFGLKVADRSSYSVTLQRNHRNMIFVKEILVWCNDQPTAT